MAYAGSKLKKKSGVVKASHVIPYQLSAEHL